MTKNAVDPYPNVAAMSLDRPRDRGALLKRLRALNVTRADFLGALIIQQITNGE